MMNFKLQNLITVLECTCIFLKFNVEKNKRDEREPPSFMFNVQYKAFPIISYSDQRGQ